MTLRSILERLSHVRQSGSGWVAKCPAHEDRSPSLSICEGGDGRVLIFCHAGCPPEKIVGAIGLTMADLFPKPRVSRCAEPEIVRKARRIAGKSLTRLPRSVREVPVTVIFCNANHIDAAIARALALAVEGQLCQIALKGESDENPSC